jgi:hypothetical protein
VDDPAVSDLQILSFPHISQGLKLQLVRCSFQASGPFPSTLASLIPFGCRPSKHASTMSGAKQVIGNSRQT